MKKIKRYTSLLFPMPTFLSGAGSVINLAGDYYELNSPTAGPEADRLAIENDFNMIGQDIFDVMVGQDIFDAIDEINADN